MIKLTVVRKKSERELNLKMKLDFLTNKKPTVTVMIQSETASNAINTIRNAVYEGADAFGLQIEALAPKEREHLSSIFSSAEGKPFYITNYPDSDKMRACLMKNVCGDFLKA